MYSLKETLSITAQRELEDIIFTGGTTFETQDFYTAKINCNSLVESTYYAKRTTDQYVCVHCGKSAFDKDGMKEKLANFNIVYPVCLLCKDIGMFLYVQKGL